MQTNKSVIISVSVGALAAAAAGAYYLYGADDAIKRRRRLKAWMLRMKADVMEEIENLKDLNQEAYIAMIDKISDKYKRLKNADPEEIAALAKKMQSHWKMIQKDINQATVTRGTKKIVAARKTTTKSTGRKNSKKKSTDATADTSTASASA